MTNQDIKFTVIIPTRERADTLKWALKTCVNQDYDNLEIIVSDNFSQDNTREIVESYQDKRIKYINTGKRISMSSNWEFALSHVTGDYVNVIGDDDGMMPGAFTKLNDIIKKLNAQAIFWDKSRLHYKWPSMTFPHVKNSLEVSFSDAEIEKIHTQEILDKLQTSDSGYATMFTMYSGTTSYELVKKISSYTGQFVNSMVPDIYSGVVIACEIDFYYYSGTPYSIQGTSSHSNGASSLGNDNFNPTPYINFLQENNIPFHRNLEFAPSLPLIIAECILQAKDHLPSAKNLNVDLVELISLTMKSAQYLPANKWQDCVNAVNKICKINNLKDDVATRAILKYPNQPFNSESKPIFGINPFSRTGMFNCAEYGVSNIYEASILLDHILQLEKNGYFSGKKQYLDRLDAFIERINLKLKRLYRESSLFRGNI
jgi:glycosyltransferase involved in cell wall biosynthesis